MKEHIGELSALGCAVVWATAVVFFKRAGSAVPAFHLNLFKNTLGAVVFLAAMLALRGWRGPGYDGGELLALAISGVVGIALADAMLLRSLELLGAGRMAVVDCLYTPSMVLSAVLLLEGETLRPAHIVGAAMIAVAVLVGGLDRSRTIPRRDLVTGLWFGVGSMVAMSIAIVAVQPLMRTHDLLPFIALRLWAAVAASLLWLALRRRLRELRLFRGPLPWTDLLLGSFLGAVVGMGLWVAGFAFSPGETATVAILNQSSVLFILVLSVLFLGERMTWRKALGGLLGFGGVVISRMQG